MRAIKYIVLMLLAGYCLTLMLYAGSTAQAPMGTEAAAAQTAPAPLHGDLLPVTQTDKGIAILEHEPVLLAAAPAAMPLDVSLPLVDKVVTAEQALTGFPRSTPQDRATIETPPLVADLFIASLETDNLVSRVAPVAPIALDLLQVGDLPMSLPATPAGGFVVEETTPITAPEAPETAIVAEAPAPAVEIVAPQLALPAPMGGTVQEPVQTQATVQMPVQERVQKAGTPAPKAAITLPVLLSAPKLALPLDTAQRPALEVQPMLAAQPVLALPFPGQMLEEEEATAAGPTMDFGPFLGPDNAPDYETVAPALPTLLLAAASPSPEVGAPAATDTTPPRPGLSLPLPTPPSQAPVAAPVVTPAPADTKAPGLTLPALRTDKASGNQPSAGQGEVLVHDPARASSPDGATGLEAQPVSGKDLANLPFPFSATSEDTAPMPATSPYEPTKGDTLLRRLPNGLTVLIRQDLRFPLVSLRLYVHAGSSYESPEQAGISHMLEHMVFKGTESFPKGSIAASVESSGGYLNAATSFDYTVYITDMTKAHWESGLGILKEMAFAPTLDPAELESEKDVVVAELKRGQDSPSGRLFDTVLAGLMANTPYERPIIGYEETIRAITSQSMRDYIRKWYQPRSMLLVISGNVDLDSAFASAEATFGSLANDPVITVPVRPVPVPASQTLFSVEAGPWQKAHLVMAFPAPAMADVRSAQLDVLSHLLGGDATSHLFRTYQYEKRLVDSISMSNYNFEGSGLVFVQATLDPDKLVPFWTAFTQDMATIGLRTFTQEELDRARLNIEDSLYRSKETLSGLTSKLGYFQFLYGSLDAEGNYLQSVQSTGQETLAALAAAIFRPEMAVVAALLPETAPQDAFGLPQGAASVAEWMQEELARNWPSPPPAASSTAYQTNDGVPSILALGNGCTLIVLPDSTLPYISATLMYTGGDSLLGRSNEGLGSFVASLLTKGTAGDKEGKKGRTANEIREFLADRAAGLVASSSRQTFTVSFDCPTRFTDDLFVLLGDILRRPALQDEEAQRVRENQIAAIVQTEDSAMSLAFRRMFPHFFPKHPYGLMSLGTKENVTAFTPDKAQQFWKKQSAQPWTLAICGNIDEEAVERGLKLLPLAKDKAVALQKPEWSGDKQLALQLAGRNQAHLMLVFPTAPLGSEDEAGLTLLQTVLDGQSGLLFRDLRDRQGLGYTVSAFNWKAQKAGAMIFYIGTQPETLDQAKEGFVRILNSLHSDLLPVAELERGKNLMEGSYHRKRQSLGARSAEAATLHTLGLPLDSEQQMIARASGLAPEDLQKLAKQYLDPARAYTVTVLP